MKRFISTVDRWGPALLSVVTLFVVCGVGWNYEKWIAKIDGETISLQHELDRRTQLEIALREEMQTYQAYVILLQRLMVEHRIKDVPKPPSVQEEKSNGRSRMQDHH